MQEESDSHAASHEQVTDKEFWSGVLKDADPDAGILADSAVAEIDKLMGDLASAREYLSAEAERVKRETARLRTLSKAAVASVQIISDNLSKWRQSGQEAA